MIDDTNRAAFKKVHDIPADLASCHTAIIDGLAFEGHVPIADMKRVLATRPKGVSGLAVAGMPMGSPGMEMPGMRAQAYDVMRSEEHTSELKSLMRISYAVYCL